MTAATSDLHGRRPFYWIGAAPPGDGNLGPDQSVVVLPIWPILYHMPDIERLSEHFIKEIQAIQSEGPYFLGGGCYNGFVAFEVARKLVASGQDVPLLVMLKPCHPSELSRQRRIVRRLALSILHPGTIVSFVAAKTGQLTRRPGKSLPSQPEPSTVEEKIAALFAERAYKSVENYVHKPYPGRVTLFVIDRMPLRSFLRLAWGKFARGGIDIRVERVDTWGELEQSKVFSAGIGNCIDKIVDNQAYTDKSAVETFKALQVSLS
jgi:thioesterase domain-containing protein